jgi:hypothetical protein
VCIQVRVHLDFVDRVTPVPIPNMRVKPGGPVLTVLDYNPVILSSYLNKRTVLASGEYEYSALDQTTWLLGISFLPGKGIALVARSRTAGHLVSELTKLHPYSFNLRDSVAHHSL